MRRRAASHPVGLVSESFARSGGVRADARRCEVSSMKAQVKNQIAQLHSRPRMQNFWRERSDTLATSVEVFGSVRTHMMFFRPWLKCLHVAIHRFRS